MQGSLDFFHCTTGCFMARLIAGSWRSWLRPAAVVILLASWVAASLGVAFGLNVSILLLTALVFPLLWPQHFGGWRGLLLLLLAIFVPTLGTAAFWSRLATAWPAAASFVLAWALAAWMMLPATVALLLWRRLASIPIMLLGMAVTPAASLLVVLTLGAPGKAMASSDAPAMLQMFAAVTPMWFVSLACCLGPIFFLGTLVWLLYLEATRGEKKQAVITPVPPAKAGAGPHSAGMAGPSGS